MIVLGDLRKEDWGISSWETIDMGKARPRRTIDRRFHSCDEILETFRSDGIELASFMGTHFQCPLERFER